MWLYLLSEEAASVTERPAWLDAARGDWHVQATVGFMGCVSSRLDEHLPRDLVNGFGTGGERRSFGRDLDTGVLLKFADAFIALLRGEITGGPGTVKAY